MLKRRCCSYDWSERMLPQFHTISTCWQQSPVANGSILYCLYLLQHAFICFPPPARWGLLDFMSVACSSSSSSPPPPRRPPRTPCPPAQLRPAIHSVLCRTSTTTIHAQCSLPDLNHDHPRPVFPAGPQPRPSMPVFPAGPQPRPSTPSVPCRTSTASIHAKCSLPDLNREYPRQVFPAGPHVGRYGTKNVQKKVRKNVRRYVRIYARRYAR